MASAKRPSYGLRITILIVVLGGILGIALNVDALLGPPPEPLEEDPASAERGLESGMDFDMEEHIAQVVFDKVTQALLEDAATGLDALPEEWTPKDLQVDKGYVEDEDEAEYYEELDQLGTVLKNSAEREHKALASLFEKPKTAAATEPTSRAKPQPKHPTKARRLALRPNAALIKKRTAKAPRARPSAAAKPRRASNKVVKAPAPEAKENVAPAASPGPAVNPHATAKELVGQGRKLLLSGDPAGAERAYRKALQKGPSSARARYGLAKALYQRNRVGEASKELQRILSGNRNHGSALLMMGSLLQEQGQTGEARKHYQRYLDSHPNGRRAGEIRSILGRL